MSKYVTQSVKQKKLKQGDTVMVRSGKDKGKQGEIMKVLPDGRMIVKDINVVTKHIKANPSLNKPGGREKVEAPIHSCKLGIVNTQTGKIDRVGFKILENGRKVRIFKSNQEVIDI